MKKIMYCLSCLVLFITLIIFCRINTYASSHLSKGKIFYDHKYKYKVIKSGTDEDLGVVQLLGFNPEYYNFIQYTPKSINIYNHLNIKLYKVTYDVTQEEFYVKSIAKGAFKNKTKIVYVQIDPYYLGYDPINISNNIPADCFMGCSNLEEVRINYRGEDTFTINKNAFKGCKKLRYLGISTLGKNIEIKTNSFRNVRQIQIDISTGRSSTVYIKKIAKKVKKAGAKKVIYVYNHRTYVIK